MSGVALSVPETIVTVEPLNDMSLSDLVARIDDARSRFSPEEFATGLVSIESDGNWEWPNYEMTIVIHRRETEAETATRLTQERQAALNASIHAAHQEMQERQTMRALMAKYGVLEAGQ